jgi:hypothetical protein
MWSQTWALTLAFSLKGQGANLVSRCLLMANLTVHIATSSGHDTSASQVVKQTTPVHRRLWNRQLIWCFWSFGVLVPALLAQCSTSRLARREGLGSPPQKKIKKFTSFWAFTVNIHRTRRLESISTPSPQCTTVLKNKATLLDRCCKAPCEQNCKNHSPSRQRQTNKQTWISEGR